MTLRAYTNATSCVFFLNGAPAARNRECTPVAGNIVVTVLPSPAQTNQTREATKSPPLFPSSQKVPDSPSESSPQRSRQKDTAFIYNAT